MTDEGYNGWRNYETWNVAMWIGEEPIYNGAVDFMKNDNPDPQNSYRAFVVSCGLEAQKTPDGVAYMGDTLDYEDLNRMMADLIQ